MRIVSRRNLKLEACALLCCFLFCSWPAASQNRNRTNQPQVSSNLQIAQIVREIRARNIEQSIEKLVSFGTRNTLSEQIRSEPRDRCGARLVVTKL